MSAAYQALEWGVVVGASEAFVKVDFGGSQRDTMTRVEMDAVIARTIAVCTFLDAKGVPGACGLALPPLHCPWHSFHKLHKSTGYPEVQDRVWEGERMGEFGKDWLSIGSPF
jgi:hypothetical protein